MGKKEIVFSGYGGQGVVMSSILYANALSLEGFNVLQTQSFGIEARGGASRSGLIYSKEEVNHLEIDQPDVLVMMSEEAFDKYSQTINKGGITVLDSHNISLTKIQNYLDINQDIKVYYHPFTEISIDKYKSDLFTNVLVLGFLCSLNNDVNIKNLKESLNKYIKPKFIEKNTAALEFGCSLK